MSSNLSRRECLTRISIATGGLCALSGLVQNAKAQGATIKILVGFPVGGTADGIARALSSAMSRDFGRTVIVESKPGASGQLAAQGVKQSPGDGLNLLLTPCSVLTLTPLLYSNPMFEGLQDFTPVLSVCEHGFGLAVSEKSPIKTLSDFMQEARKRLASYATPGAGSGPHLLGTIFSQSAKLQLNHVAYRGVAPGIQDLMGGQVDASIHPLSSLLTHHKSGRLRILATTLPKRNASTDRIPTFSELGFEGMELIERYGIFVSTKTSPAIVADLQMKIFGLMNSTEMQNMSKNMEIEVRGQLHLNQLQQAERANWQKIVKTTGVTLNS